MCFSAYSVQQVAPLYFAETDGNDKPTKPTHTKDYTNHPSMYVTQRDDTRTYLLLGGVHLSSH